LNQRLSEALRTIAGHKQPLKPQPLQQPRRKKLTPLMREISNDIMAK
jgi:hypothetical protein